MKAAGELDAAPDARPIPAEPVVPSAVVAGKVKVPRGPRTRREEPAGGIGPTGEDA